VTAPASAAWLGAVVRWGQVNINRTDVETLDIDAWLEYWKSCRLQAVTLNAGGALAFYPTDLPLQPRAPGVERRDVFGEAVAAARSAGMHVLARLDVGPLMADLVAQRPDWCVTARDGSPVCLAGLALLRGPGVPPLPEGQEPLYAACIQSPYYSEHVRDIATEVLARYDVDGFFTNGWPPEQNSARSPLFTCHCAHCTAAWSRAHQGRLLPSVADAGDPDWRSYVGWLQQRVATVQRQLAQHVASVRKGAVFVPATFASLSTPLQWDRWVEEVPALASDAQGRRTTAGVTLPPSLWEIGQQSELVRSVARGRPRIRFSATWHAAAPEHRHVARPPWETRLHMLEAVAHGERPKWHTLGGTPRDRRWMPHVAELQRWLADHDRYLQNVAAVDEVGIVWSPRSIHAATWSGPGGPSHSDAVTGWYAALVESRAACAYVHEDALDDLDRFDVLVLPSGLGLGAEARAHLRAFRLRGGSLVACAGALWLDDWGTVLQEEEQREVLGLHWTDRLAPLANRIIGSWALDTEDESGLLDGLGDTDLLPGPQWATPFVVDGPALRGGALIPSCPTQPTHDVVLHEPRRDLSLLATTRRQDGGITVILGADLDAAYGRSLSVDHARVLGNAVRAARSRQPAVVVEGEGFVDVRTWLQASSATVYLVNLDNRMLYGPPVRDLRPTGPFRVVLRVADLGWGPTVQVSAVHVLRAERTPIWSTQDDGTVVVEVPEIRDVEVVAFDLRETTSK